MIKFRWLETPRNSTKPWTFHTALWTLFLANWTTQLPRSLTWKVGNAREIKQKLIALKVGSRAVLLSVNLFPAQTVPITSRGDCAFAMGKRSWMERFFFAFPIISFAFKCRWIMRTCSMLQCVPQHAQFAPSWKITKPKMGFWCRPL